MHSTIKLCLGSLALFALHAVIIVTPALAQEHTPTVPSLRTPSPAPTVVLPPQLVTGQAFRCSSRPLVQGSGTVRVCESPRAL